MEKELKIQIQKYAFDKFNVFVRGDASIEDDLINILVNYFDTNGIYGLPVGIDKYDITWLEASLTVMYDSFLKQSDLNKTLFTNWEDLNVSEESILKVISFINYTNIFGKRQYTVENGNIVISDFVEDNIEKYYTVDVVDSITYKEFILRIKKMLLGNVGLTSDEIKLFISIYKEDKFIELSEICNREFLNAAYLELGIVPFDAEEFLRLVVLKYCDSELYIKNEEIINTLAVANVDILQDYYNDYALSGLIELSTVFNRNKTIFLAMKQTPGNRKIINKISKLSKKYHVPVNKDNILDIYSKYSKDEFDKYLDKQSIKKLNSLYKYLKYRSLYFNKHQYSMVCYYRIRNGTHFTKIQYYAKSQAKMIVDCLYDVSHMLNVKLLTKVQPLKGNYGIEYALPSSGKNFIGNIPEGSYINLPGDNYIFGIQWYDIEGRSTDLDLSLTNAAEKIGWDSKLKSYNVFFSGDVTSAAIGASELFYIKDLKDTWYKINVNFYNNEDFDYPENIEFKFFIAKAPNDVKIQKNVMCDVEDIIYKTTFKFPDPRSTFNIGSVIDNKFVFDPINIRVKSNIVSTSDTEYTAKDVVLNTLHSRFMLGKLKEGIGKDEILELLKD